MIIVEGPDGGGKTTFITKLQKKLNLPIAPRVVSKDAEAMVDLKMWVENNVLGGFQQTIFDRHRLISEPIYGPILRGEQAPGFSDMDWMRDVMYHFYHSKPILIYCIPPLDIVINNVMGDEDNKVVHTTIKQIYTAYVARAAIDVTIHHGAVIYDYTADPDLEFDPRLFNSIQRLIGDRS